MEAIPSPSKDLVLLLAPQISDFPKALELTPKIFHENIRHVVLHKAVGTGGQGEKIDMILLLRAISSCKYFCKFCGTVFQPKLCTFWTSKNDLFHKR